MQKLQYQELAVGRTTKTEQCAVLATVSATLPSATRLMADRPKLPNTIMSAGNLAAWRRISSSGIPSVTTAVPFAPNLVIDDSMSSAAAIRAVAMACLSGTMGPPPKGDAAKDKEEEVPRL